MLARVSISLISLLLSGCVYGPPTLNVRVCNVTPMDIRVERADAGATGDVQVVIPGGTALEHAPALIVRGPKVTTRVAAGPLSRVSDGAGYRYAHRVIRGIGQNDVVFDVMVDEDGRVWAQSKEGRRVEFPAEALK